MSRVNITLRVPEDVRARLEAEAKAGERSLNAEIIRRLERSFDREEMANLVWEAMQPMTTEFRVSQVDLNIPDTHDCSFN